MDGCCTGRGLASIVPDGGHSQVVSDVALLSVKDLAQRLLQLVAHRLPQVEEVVGSHVDLRLAGWQRGQVDGVDVCVPGEHELQLEPFDLLHARLGVACGCQCISDVGSPAHDLLVLVIVEHCGDLESVMLANIAGWWNEYMRGCLLSAWSGCPRPAIR